MSSASQNIAFIRRRFSPTGGAERYLIRLASGLLQLGHKLTLYCEQWTPQESPFTTVQTVETNDPTAFSSQIQKLNLRQKHPVVFSLERVPGCHIYRAGDGLHIEWLAHRNRVQPILGPLRAMLRSKNRALCALEAQLFTPESTDRVICNSRFVADQITSRFSYPADRIDIVHNGIPVEQYASGNREQGRAALGLKASDYVVLLVGAGKERKGHRYAKAAVARCKSRPRLVIIDSPQPVAMPYIYAAADVFLLPTLYDPFANVTLEALAAGLPVITTAQNGASEILSDQINGFILPSPTETRLSAQIIDSLADPAFRQSFRKSAQTLAQSFDITRNIEETLAVFQKLQPST